MLSLYIDYIMAPPEPAAVLMYSKGLTGDVV